MFDTSQIKIRSIKKNEQYDGRMNACELKAEILNKVQSWTVYNKTSTLQLFSEWLKFFIKPRNKVIATTFLSPSPPPSASTVYSEADSMALSTDFPLAAKV